MKIFTTDELVNYMIETIAGWTDDQIKKAVNCPETVSMYVNDWFSYYDITKSESNKIVSAVIDFFNED